MAKLMCCKPHANLGLHKVCNLLAKQHALLVGTTHARE